MVEEGVRKRGALCVGAARVASDVSAELAVEGGSDLGDKMVVTRGMIKEILWSETLRLIIGWPRHPCTCAGLVIEMELLVDELVSARVRVANG